ncbi:hypothetical protein A5N17_10355 [Arthrobacter sp. D2]|nr:hypothetical protein [Arthrobacter sp. M5]NKR14924.1 hypothetical protein [Arthrobacter sp. M6]OEH62471.1 hypothetical protein A5N13_02115 [Arthrobacter sp. D4]OEH63042.1 hypothetical protein A5N17_10355 [Arthrobacter sp. D2]
MSAHRQSYVQLLRMLESLVLKIGDDFQVSVAQNTATARGRAAVAGGEQMIDGGVHDQVPQHRTCSRAWRRSISLIVA